MKHIITGRRRQSTNASSSLIAKWSHLEKQIREILSQIYKLKIKRQYKFQFSVLKSLPRAPNQSVHCDHVGEGMLTSTTTTPIFYDLNIFISISLQEDTFLDLRPANSSKWYRVPVSRGDIIIFRGDIAHRGVKHDKDYDHYRIHCYADNQKRANNTTTFVSVPFE